MPIIQEHRLVSLPFSRPFIHSLADYLQSYYLGHNLPITIIVPTNILKLNLQASIINLGIKGEFIIQTLEEIALEGYKDEKNNAITLINPEKTIAIFVKAFFDHIQFFHTHEEILKITQSLCELFDELKWNSVSSSQLRNRETIGGIDTPYVDCFLEVFKKWEDYLLKTSQLDQASWRINGLKNLQLRWGKTPFPTPFILAGFTTFPKEILEFSKAVLGLPRGEIVFYGDFYSIPSFQNTHLSKVYTELKQLVKATHTHTFLADQTSLPLFHRSLHKFSDHFDEEEYMINLIRKKLSENKIIAIPISDELIAKNVMQRLKNEGFSYNTTFEQTTIDKQFHRILLEWIDYYVSPSLKGLINILKSYTFSQIMGESHFDNLCHFEIYLRKKGIFPYATFENELKAFCEENPSYDNWALNLLSKIKVFLDAFDGNHTLNFPSVMQHYIKMLMYQEETQTSLNHLNTLVESLKDIFSTSVMEGMDKLQWPGLVRHLLEKVESSLSKEDFTNKGIYVCRPSELPHLQASIVIVPHFIEGNWPAIAQPDYWLGENVRRNLHLDTLEDKTFEGEYHFRSLQVYEEVYFTYTLTSDMERKNQPSRWTSKLDVSVEEVNTEIASYDKSWNNQTVAYPKVSIPLEHRPKKLSVTAIQRLIQDPYGFYAQYILRLKPLPDLQDYTSREKGIIYHNAISLFFEQGYSPFSSDNMNVLKNLGIQLLQPFQNKYFYPFWQERFNQSIPWLFQQWNKEPLMKSCMNEFLVETMVTIKNIDYTIYAKIDQMDQIEDGYRLIDYKTGQLPSKKDIRIGLSPQLPLEAFIITNNRNSIKEMTFYKIGGLRSGRLDLDDIPTLVEGVKEKLDNLLGHFSEPSAGYLACPVPDQSPTYNDYEHLERLKERALCD